MNYSNGRQRQSVSDSLTSLILELGTFCPLEHVFLRGINMEVAEDHPDRITGDPKSNSIDNDINL